MADPVISTAHRAARNQASIDLADASAGNSCLKLYAAPAGVLLGTRTLAKPCGTINAAGQIVLQVGASNDLIAADGTVTYAEWCDGAGVPIASGAVTDDAGAGPFKLQGGTTVYAGGLILLATPAIWG